jgi:glycosyltransferase involved in cell wall biosynthesis
MIEFIHPALMNYRIELFEKLQKKYDIKFIFINHQLGKQFGGIKIPREWNFENLNLLKKKSLINWSRFINKLLKDDYDLIIVGPPEQPYFLVTFLISKLRTKKIIAWGEGWHWTNYNCYQKLYNTILKIILKKADAIIASGEKSQNFYKQILKKEVKIYNIHNYVIPYHRKDPSKLLKKLAENDNSIINKKIVLYLSRIIKIKGLDYLIKAFKILENKLNDVYLLIVGSGDFEKHCKKLAKDLKIKNIMFAGYTSNEKEIELYYNLSNVFVLPSIFYKDSGEAIGYVVCESMGVGKPVVVTNAVGAAPEYIQNNINGFVVKEKNIEELYEALLKILSNKKLAKKMGVKSKEIYDEKLNLEKQYEAFKNVIDYFIKK